MEKTGAIYYKNVFGFLHCGNDVRSEKHQVNVVFGNLVQALDIDDYFIFARGRIFLTNGLFSILYIRDTRIGFFFVHCIFIIDAASNFLSINVLYCGPIGYILRSQFWRRFCVYG